MRTIFSDDDDDDKSFLMMKIWGILYGHPWLPANSQQLVELSSVQFADSSAAARHRCSASPGPSATDHPIPRAITQQVGSVSMGSAPQPQKHEPTSEGT